MSRVLAADIGATRARFAVFDENGHCEQASFESSAHADGAVLAERFLHDLGLDVAACCVAVAGPVTNGVGETTNSGLRIDRAELVRRLQLDAVAVVNDLVALGHGLRELPESGFRQIGGRADATGAKAVLAPGTGLGMAVLVDDGDATRCLASEGGHAPFAPADPLEQEVLGLLFAELGYVSWEDVVSGPGLERLYRAVCQVWGSKPVQRGAPVIAELGMSMTDPVCHQTLGMFCAILGSAAGSLALTSCATGGVYIGGGIVPQILEFLIDSAFRRRFDERGSMSAYVRSIPIYAVLDADTGLKGAARYAWGLLEEERRRLR
ncbi:MAG: glucokinase [Gammaproteobacteria bacterium]|nr:glucokinase [Gammaproteobacteria bacterium]